MKQYRKSIGTLNYNTQNMPGSPKTHVFIENHPNPYFFYAPKKEWVVQPNYSGAPDLPAEQLEALEAALVEHEESRLRYITEANERSRHINGLTADEENVLEICTVYKGSFSVNGNEPPKVSVTSEQTESGEAWLSYFAEHSPGKVKEVRRRLPDGDHLSLASKKIRAQMEEDLEYDRLVEGTGQDALHHFETAHQNAAGVALNKRVTAVYALSGYIHETLRNHPDYPNGKPHWQYILSDGSLTQFESEVSALDVRKQILVYREGRRDEI